jgi:trk system potassium uptake protein TrkA
MKVIIGGCGRVGSMLAVRFTAEGHDVVVVDRDATAFCRLGKRPSVETVRGVVFDKDALDAAGMDRADAYIAVTSGDNSNVVSATVAREIYRVPKVVARIFDPRRAEIYRRLGIQTVSSVHWATNEIVSLVVYPHLVRDVALGDGEVQLVKISIHARLAGRLVNDLAVPAQIQPVAVVRAGTSFIPTGQEPLLEGDVLEVAVAASSMANFQRMVTP